VIENAKSFILLEILIILWNSIFKPCFSAYLFVLYQILTLIVGLNLLIHNEMILQKSYCDENNSIWSQTSQNLRIQGLQVHMMGPVGLHLLGFEQVI